MRRITPTPEDDDGGTGSPLLSGSNILTAGRLQTLRCRLLGCDWCPVDVLAARYEGQYVLGPYRKERCRCCMTERYVGVSKREANAWLASAGGQ